jgi:EAL domain-containing protein (putative c-di-GMP-specific phosphodiesterase class I)
MVIMILEEALLILMPVLLVVITFVVLLTSYLSVRRPLLLDEKTKRFNQAALKKDYKKIVKKMTNHYAMFIQVNQLDALSHMHGLYFYDQVVATCSSALEHFFDTKIIYYLGSAKFFLVIDETCKKTYKDDEFIHYMNQVMQIKYFQNVLRYRLSMTELSPKNDLRRTLKMLYLAANVYQDTRLNQCVVYETALETVQTKTHQIVEALISYIHNPSLNNLSLKYQPILHADNHKIAGVEVLSRFKVEGYGNINPETFIKIAERFGLIEALGKIIIEKSFNAFKTILSLNKDCFISINISPLQLKDKTFPHFIESLVKNYHYHPAQIHLEITETAFATNYETFIDNIKVLKKKGFPIYLDDFGVGYSSFKYMIDTGINGIKLDRYFTQKISVDIGYDMFSQGLAFMVKGLNGSLTIEGIENKEEAAYFKRLGANYFQGFYFYKPLSLESFNKAIKKDVNE